MSKTDPLTPAYFSCKGPSREDVVGTYLAAVTKTLTENNLGGFTLDYSLRARVHGCRAGMAEFVGWEDMAEPPLLWAGQMQKAGTQSGPFVSSFDSLFSLEPSHGAVHIWGIASLIKYTSLWPLLQHASPTPQTFQSSTKLTSKFTIIALTRVV